MNPSGLYNGNGTYYNNGWNRNGWPGSNMYSFIQNDIYNLLPSELKNAIIETKVVSGHGKGDTDNFISTDKLYLLSTGEIWSGTLEQIEIRDSARTLTRQLDYYKKLGISTNNYSGAIKENETIASIWWLRVASSINTDSFLYVSDDGNWGGIFADFTYGVSPAFRLG